MGRHQSYTGFWLDSTFVSPMILQRFRGFRVQGSPGRESFTEEPVRSWRLGAAENFQGGGSIALEAQTHNLLTVLFDLGLSGLSEATSCQSFLEPSMPTRCHRTTQSPPRHELELFDLDVRVLS